MLSISYRNQIFILLLWIAVVMALFRFIPEKQVAAVIAGSGFILFPVWFLISEVTGRKDKVHLAVLGIFLVFAALPIFLLRVLNWGSEFASLEVLGVSGNALHKASNYLYILMLISTVYCFIKIRKKSTN